MKILVKNSVQEDLERLKRYAVKYGRNSPTAMEKDLLSFENKAVLVWPEDTEEKSAYWIPEDIFSWSGNFIRSQLQFKNDYQRFVDKE